MPEIVIVRGVPGTGKTFLAKTRYPDHVLCEADQFFEVRGQYKYDRDKIREAHRWCRKKARKALASGNNIVVANTFVSEWEVTPYRKMGYAIEIIEATGHYKNVHGVPDEIVERMRQNFEVIGDQKHNK